MPQHSFRILNFESKQDLELGNLNKLRLALRKLNIVKSASTVVTNIFNWAWPANFSKGTWKF